jgi:hypothetical protein
LACLQISHTAQRDFPGFLQLGGDQTVVGIACCIATLSETGLVTGLLKFQIEDLALIILSFPIHSLRLERSLDRQRFYRAQQFTRNSHVYPGAPEGHAPG